MRPKWEQLTLSHSLAAHQPPEDALSARGVSTLHRLRRDAESVSDVLAPSV